MFEKIKNLFKKKKRQTLLEIQAQKGFKTDKGTIHSYLETYDEILGQYTNPSILEIGVDKGESLRLWKAMFPDAIVHGVDIELKNKRSIPGCEVFIADINTWEPPRKYDIIIDDASHKYRDQMTSFVRLFEKYCRGYYIIEDVQNMANARMLMNLNLEKASVHDFREVKGREDDIMVIFKK